MHFHDCLVVGVKCAATLILSRLSRYGVAFSARLYLRVMFADAYGSPASGALAITSAVVCPISDCSISMLYTYTQFAFASEHWCWCLVMQCERFSTISRACIALARARARKRDNIWTCQLHVCLYSSRAKGTCTSSVTPARKYAYA